MLICVNETNYVHAGLVLQVFIAPPPPDHGGPVVQPRQQVVVVMVGHDWRDAGRIQIPCDTPDDAALKVAEIVEEVNKFYGVGVVVDKKAASPRS